MYMCDAKQMYMLLFFSLPQQREVSVIGSRCRVRDNNPICPVEVVDPESATEIVKDVRLHVHDFSI